VARPVAFGPRPDEGTPYAPPPTSRRIHARQVPSAPSEPHDGGRLPGAVHGGASALGLAVDSGKPPFTTNSGTKVDNLNADRLDGHDSSYFLPVFGKAADANALDGIDSSGFIEGREAS
jgi:hypothetical protein